MVSIMSVIDQMSGLSFEHFCANVLEKLGFSRVHVTPGTGDQGVDILAVKDGIKYAIQCKNYASPLGNTPVQEVAAGIQYYHCHVGVVMTNSHFTSGAIDLAKATNVLLWDRETLETFILRAGGPEVFGFRTTPEEDFDDSPLEDDLSDLDMEDNPDDPAFCADGASAPKRRKGMQGLAFFCYFGIVVGFIELFVLRSLQMLGMALFYLAFGVMFQVLALSPKGCPRILGRDTGLKKTTFVCICVVAACVVILLI